MAGIGPVAASGVLALDEGGWVMAVLDSIGSGEECHSLISYEVTASGPPDAPLGILMKEPWPGPMVIPQLRVAEHGGSLSFRGEAHWVGTCADVSYFFASNGAMSVDFRVTDEHGNPFPVSFMSTGGGTIVGTADRIDAGPGHVAAADVPVRAGWAHVQIESDVLVTDAACAAASARAIYVEFPGQKNFLGVPTLPSVGASALATVEPPGFPFCFFGAGLSTTASALGASRVETGTMPIRVVSADVPWNADVFFANVPMTDADYPPDFFHGYYWVS